MDNPRQAESLVILENMRTRRSERQFTSEPVSKEDLTLILQCAMLAPSAVNEQPWEFVIITEPELLKQIPPINRYAVFAESAPVSILICVNTREEKVKGIGIVDVSMCSQNILLAAHALGLGAVFTGVYPIQERMEGFQKLFNLPDYALPAGLIVLGHTKSAISKNVPDRFKKQKIHMQRWS